jgi:hypothetical protein
MVYVSLIARDTNNKSSTFGCGCAVCKREFGETRGEVGVLAGAKRMK